MMRNRDSLTWGDTVWVHANTMGLVSSDITKKFIRLKGGEVGLFFQEIGDRSIVMFEHATLSVESASIRLTSRVL